MRFLGRWISDSVVLAVSLLAAALFMQIPAVTHAYASALLQVAQEARRDIDQRESAARQYYHMTADTDDALLAALKPLEPANADALAQSIGRARDFQAEYDRISASPPLTQPVTAALGVLRDAGGARRAVLADDALDLRAGDHHDAFRRDLCADRPDPRLVPRADHRDAAAARPARCRASHTGATDARAWTIPSTSRASSPRRPR